MPWGGVRTLLTHCKSNEFFKNFAKRIYSKSRKNQHKKINSKGTVLIEFAICIPIFVILLFYAHDLVRLYRYQAQTEFVTQQMVNLIQNISQNRENKKITLNDLRYCFSTAYLSCFPGTSMFYKDSGHELIYVPFIEIYYVKGLAGGKASTYYRINMQTCSTSCVKPATMHCGPNSNGWSYSSIKYLSNTDPKNIHPSLKINEGEKKIIIESLFYWISSYKNLEGIAKSTLKEAVNCYLATPTSINSSSTHSFFHSVSIFTPKPGLFDETAPQ